MNSCPHKRIIKRITVVMDIPIFKESLRNEEKEIENLHLWERNVTKRRIMFNIRRDYVAESIYLCEKCMKVL